MKRMNLIRAALFAVFAFMGTVSLSAQQNWLPPAQAIVVINNELELIAEPPAPTPTTVITSQQQLLEERAMVGCDGCLQRSVKYHFLELSLIQIKSGVDTGNAVEGVRAQMIGNANGNATLLTNIQTAYEYMQNVL